MAAIYSNLNDPQTSEYLKDLERMTKVVLKANSEQEILAASEILKENNIEHHIWREQPENIISSLATVPRNRDLLKPLLKDFKLFR